MYIWILGWVFVLFYSARHSNLCFSIAKYICVDDSYSEVLSNAYFDDSLIQTSIATRRI